MPNQFFDVLVYNMQHQNNDRIGIHLSCRKGCNAFQKFIESLLIFTNLDPFICFIYFNLKNNRLLYHIENEFYYFDFRLFKLKTNEGIEFLKKKKSI